MTATTLECDLQNRVRVVIPQDGELLTSSFIRSTRGIGARDGRPSNSSPQHLKGTADPFDLGPNFRQAGLQYQIGEKPVVHVP